MFGFVICVSVFVVVVVISGCKIDFFFFKDWVGSGHGFRLGPEVAGQYSWVPIGWVWGKKKKIRLLNRPGSGNGGGPTGRVRVSKNSP